MADIDQEHESDLPKTAFFGRRFACGLQSYAGIRVDTATPRNGSIADAPTW